MDEENKQLRMFIDFSDYKLDKDNATSTYSLAKTWYDEFIISKEAIAAPQGVPPVSG
jgi:hypothetical protein